MRRKDYQAIAEALHVTSVANPRSTIIVEEAAKNLATVFSDDNPRFNRERFLLAAILGGNYNGR